jgi:hypothetical protein
VHQRIPARLSAHSGSVKTHLQEHPSIHAIRLVVELGREDDSHTIVAGTNENGFRVTVLDDLELTLLSGGDVHLLGTGGLLVVGLQSLLLLKSGEEGGSKRVALDEREMGDELRALFYKALATNSDSQGDAEKGRFEMRPECASQLFGIQLLLVAVDTEHKKSRSRTTPPSTPTHQVSPEYAQGQC